MSQTLHGGPFNGGTVSGSEEDDSWIIRYTLNGNPWTPPNGVFYTKFPKGVERHGYRKQGKKDFNHVWSRPVS